MDLYMRRRLAAGGALALVVFVLAVVLAGGDEEEPASTVAQIGETTTGTATLTQDDVIAEGDAICAEASGAQSSDATDDAELARQQAGTASEALAALTAIQAPDEGRGAFDEFISAYAERAELLDQRMQALERDDSTALAEIDAALADAEQTAEAAAARYGFEDCAGETSGGDGGGADGGTGTDVGTETTPGTEPVTPAPTTTTPVPTTTTPVTPAPAPEAPIDPGGGAPSPAPPAAPPADGGGGGTGGLGPG